MKSTDLIRGNKRNNAPLKIPGTWFGILLLVLILGVPGTAPALKVGDRLPQFRLVDLEGNLHTETTHLGHVLVLYFFGFD